MATDRLPPPPAYERPLVDPGLHVIEPGATLYRVFVSRSDRGPLDWNYDVAPIASGGRFDPTPGDRYPYLYGALDRTAAIVGTLRSLAAESPSGARVIARTEISTRAIQRFRVTQPVALLSLLSEADRARANAPATINVDRDRPSTRAWGNYFRQVTEPGISGIAYESAVLSDSAAGVSFVLWGDRLGDQVLEPLGRPEPIEGGPVAALEILRATLE
ncbi:RES domain-containing protein [Nocardioides marmoriginsengisoli]|uniref:RES domain-containing protein n=1 Tax=Nocardioides marmoriginsengisoli TaxID=661483 RepID=A0A3N0CPL1_9ACTN|nr:RES family NAD+ phosphorylase [Nocardioides marmoriginsengisoli]RNL65407.1 RES domain-containing protein [Nocardioides marmoriginsengisoli]